MKATRRRIGRGFFPTKTRRPAAELARREQHKKIVSMNRAEVREE
jgi:hypothetical protein